VQETESPVESLGRLPELADLSDDARCHVMSFIIRSALGGGSAPSAVMELYGELGDDPQAIRYLDRRFVMHELPSDWRDIDERVVELDHVAHSRGVDLAALWRRAGQVTVQVSDPLEQLERLAGSAGVRIQAPRSIFDDPEDLDEEIDESALYQPMSGALPDIVDLAVDAQARIRQYAIEERLERGLAPIELLELYRHFEDVEDERARQYLDRVFVHNDPPFDWVDLQDRAQAVAAEAEMRGLDAGKLFATVVGTGVAEDPLLSLEMVRERLDLWRGRPSDATERLRR
jgi:hypothetical protein